MNNIKKFRTASGLTQDQLAKACGFKNRSRINQYETGTRIPSIEDAHKVVQVLNDFGCGVDFAKVFPRRGVKVND